MAFPRQLSNVFRVMLATIVAVAFVAALVALTGGATTGVRETSYTPAQRPTGENWHRSAGENWHTRDTGDNRHVTAGENWHTRDTGDNSHVVA